MTPVLQVENLSKAFGVHVLFKDISFGMELGQKVGLIARNGMGKSTLLRILAGREPYDSGSVIFRNDLKIGYLAQDPDFDPSQTVLEACFSSQDGLTALVRDYEKAMEDPSHEGLDELMERMDQQNAWNFELRSKQVLGMLKIHDLTKRVSTMSGGQLKRLALAAALIAEPDFLIMDEPTNHLDLEMVEWLEEYLKRSTLTLLMVTHDRYFLDRVCSDIIEIDELGIFSYRGNYAYYLEKRQERLNARQVEVQRANNLYRKELDWMRRMPQARGHKAEYRKQAFYELEKVAGQRLGEDNVRLEVKASYIGKKIFEARDLRKSFGETKILDGFSYIFSRYEKMGIVGNNGTGKSSFLKVLMGELPLDGGVLEIGTTVRFGYYSQAGMEFNEQMKVIDAVRDIAEVVEMGTGERLGVSQFLQHFLFTPQMQYDYIYKLSGGERRRLYLCTVLMRNPNFLILDEPTNDLDIVTLNVLEEYLRNFHGCLIVVSHDRFFMDKVVDHLLVFRGQGQIEDFPGNYTQLRNSGRDLSLKPAAEESVPQKPSGQKVRMEEGRKRKTYKEKMEFQKLDGEIQKLEQEKKDIEEALNSGNLSSEILSQHSIRHGQICDELDEKSMRWLELSELDD